MPRVQKNLNAQEMLAKITDTQEEENTMPENTQSESKTTSVSKEQLCEAGRELCLQYFTLAKERRLNSNEQQVFPIIVQLYQAVMQD